MMNVIHGALITLPSSTEEILVLVQVLIMEKILSQILVPNPPKRQA